MSVFLRGCRRRSCVADHILKLKNGDWRSLMVQELLFEVVEMPIGFDVLALLIDRCKHRDTTGPAGKSDLEGKGKDLI